MARRGRPPKKKEVIPMDKFEETLEKLLKEYAKDTYDTIEILAHAYADKGAQMLRAESEKQGWGKTTEYPEGWTTRYEANRYSRQGIIFNKVSGMPHLLEHGHAMPQGGRSRKIVHIAPVEREISEEFEKAVRDSL